MSASRAKAQRRATGAKAKAPAKPAVPPGGLPAGAAEGGDAPQASGVFVTRESDGKGGFVCNVVPVGDVSILEVDSILALGRRGFKERAGLGD